MGKTGLSFGAFKEYLGLLPGLIEQYINSHREAIGEGNAIVGLMDKINQERGKAVPAHVSSLNLAGIEEDIAEARGAVVSPMTVASIQEDVSEAHSAVDSPSTVDKDIKQPVKSVPEAAKVAWNDDSPPDDGPDYYDFPKNWSEEPTMESHDKLQLLKSIRPGDRVTILVPAGRGRNGQEWKESTGRAVIVSEGHVALNMGGQHGTPGVATVENLVSVRHAKRGAEKIAQRLIPGSELTPQMRKQVENAFIYRWTKDNQARVKTYLHYMGGECPKCDIRNPYVNEQSAEGHPHPTIPLIDDNQWINEHAFSFTNDGRLVTRGDGRHAQPAYLAQHSEERVASVQQKFAVLKAATAAEQFSCCDGFESHKDNCSVKGTDSTSKHTAMIGHLFDDADGQAIRNDLAEDTGKDPQAFHTTEQRQPRMARGLMPPGRSKEECPACGDTPCTCEDNCKNGAGSNSGNDDPRGNGDLWRETYYETQEGISPKAMMNGLKKDAQGSGNTTTTMQEQNVTDPMAPMKGQPMAVPEAIDQAAGPHSPNAPATAPRTPGIQPKIVNVPPGTEAETGMQAVQSSLEVCPRCKSANTEIDAKVGGYDVYCENCEGITASSKTADLFDDGSEPSIENDVAHMSEEQKGQWLEAHGWAKENDHHGATWWLGSQQWYKPGYEEEIPVTDTDTAIEKEIDMQYKDEEEDVMEGTCRECGAAINNAEGTICPACSAQGAEDRHDPLAEHVGAAERVKLKCNECGKHFSVSPNAADPDCPKCGGVDWDVVDDGQPKQSADAPYATYDRLKKFHEEWGNKIFPDDKPKEEEHEPLEKEAAPLPPNVQQNMNAKPGPQNTQGPSGGVSVALMPGQEEQGEDVGSGYGGNVPMKRSIEPELAQGEFLMRGSLEDLVASEVAKLANGDAFEKLAGHFYTTVEGKGKNKQEAQRAAIDEFLYEHGNRHDVREVLDPKFIRKEPPMGVTYVERGVTHHDYTKPNTAAPEKDWVEVWEFNLHTHA
jgi:predicted  nucleic acid-binding Zn-ribbon protein